MEALGVRCEGQQHLPGLLRLDLRAYVDELDGLRARIGPRKLEQSDSIVVNVEGERERSGERDFPKLQRAGSFPHFGFAEADFGFGLPAAEEREGEQD
jgi:hypothetical protein